MTDTSKLTHVLFPIDLDPATLGYLVANLGDYIAELDPETEAAIIVQMNRSLDRITAVIKDYCAMRAATRVYECDHFIAFEDPKRGDEAPLWIWDKSGINGLDKDGPFYDVSDPSEIVGWLKGMQAAAL
jgi:hypothetical protein